MKATFLYTSHDLDVDWKFFCRHDDHKEENAKLISLNNASRRDQSINDSFEIPKGIGAERKINKEK